MSYPGDLYPSGLQRAAHDLQLPVPCLAHPANCPNGPEPHAYHPPETEGLPCCRQPREDPR